MTTQGDHPLTPQKRARQEQQRIRRMSRRICGICRRGADQMTDWGEQTVAICCECLVVKNALRNLPSNLRAERLLEAALILVQKQGKEDVPYEFPVVEYERSQRALYKCVEICAGILRPKRIEISEEEEDLLSAKESQALEEYLRGRIG